MNEYKFYILSAIIVFIMLFCNRKVRIFSVLVEQMKVFKNAKTKKFSAWDIICFLILPICLSVVITIGFDCIIDNELASLFTTVFSLVFTVLFGFATILAGKLDSKNKMEKQVVGETFVSIVSSTILSLVCVVLSVIITKAIKSNILVYLSIVVYSVAFVNIMLMLLIIKRTYIVYCNSFDDKD